MRHQQYLEELKEIESQNGGFLNPPDVVEFAKNPKTALHQCFTWDDGEAAQQWRLNQARQLIRVMVSVMPTGEVDTKVRAFVSLKDARYNKMGYQSTVEVLSDKSLRGKLLQEAGEDMQAFMAKYQTLQELAGVFEQMEMALGKKSRREGAAGNRPKYRKAAAATG